LLIRRSWHSVEENHLKDGHCPKCGQQIPGRWTSPHSNRGISAATLARARALADRRFAAINF
jgi:NMD protein affecting ribosome stability and mRNA decay